MPRTIARHGGAAVALASLTVAALAGCSSSTGRSPSTSTTTAPAATPTTQAAEPAAETQLAPASSADNLLTIQAVDSGDQMSYEISGSPHAGLTTISFANTGDEAHEMGLSRLKNGATLEQLKALLTSQDPDAESKARALQVDPDTEVGGPAILGPGLSEKVTLKLTAGHYVVTCFLPGKGGMPHVAMGMIGEFTVAGADSDATAPTPDGTVSLTDAGITVPSGFHGGGTVEVANTGTKPHDFSIAKLVGQPLPAYFQCVAGSLGKGTPIDQCPGTLSGGVQTVRPGQSVYLTLPTLPAGQYGYVSTQGGGTDFQAGLNGTFVVG